MKDELKRHLEDTHKSILQIEDFKSVVNSFEAYEKMPCLKVQLSGNFL